MKKALLVTLFLVPAVLARITTTNTFAQEAAIATGPYLGQAVLGDTAALFAPGVFNRMMDRDVSMSPDGQEM